VQWNINDLQNNFEENIDERAGPHDSMPNKKQTLTGTTNNFWWTWSLLQGSSRRTSKELQYFLFGNEWHDTIMMTRTRCYKRSINKFKSKSNQTSMEKRKKIGLFNLKSSIIVVKRFLKDLKDFSGFL
jgi:hypothetical protein